MKKWLTILLLLPCFAYAQNTVVLPNGTVSRTMQLRSLGTDTLRQHWLNDGLGYNRIFTATEVALLLRTRGALTATDGTLTFSGSYNGMIARTVGLNLANPNTWSALQSFSTATNALTFNPAASTETGILWQQGGVNKARQYLTASGNLVFSYYVGSTLTTGYSLNTTSGIVTFIQSPIVPTPSANDNSTKVASTAYVDAAITNSVLQIVEITGTSQTAQAGRLYIPHNASLTTITLPATANIGALIQVVGEGAGKWQIQHGNATDVIVGISGFTTVAGTTHGIIASDQNGTISLRKTNTNKWTFTTLNGTVSAY